ncbi:MAG: hypothetical protein ACP5GL_04105 [Infirmifilum sp.]
MWADCIPLFWLCLSTRLCQRLFRGPNPANASLRAYAGILLDQRRALQSMEAMLRGLVEYRGMLESLLEEWEAGKTY